MFSIQLLTCHSQSVFTSGMDPLDLVMSFGNRVAIFSISTIDYLSKSKAAAIGISSLLSLLLMLVIVEIFKKKLVYNQVSIMSCILILCILVIVCNSLSACLI